MAEVHGLVGGTGVTAVSAPESSAWAPLRNSLYRMLFLAQLVSNIGGWMQTVGAQWFLVERSASTTVIASVQTASLAPTLLLALFAGVLADALDRRILLLVIGVASSVTAGVLTVLAWTDALTPIGLLASTFVLGCWTSLSAPAWQAIQPELVPREQIPAASALGSVTVNAARAIGPAVAGVLVAFAGPTFVFGLNALSFLAVVGALLGWKRPRTDTSGRERLGESLLTGLRYVRSGPIIRRIIVRSALFAFPASALWALLPSIAASVLDLGAMGYGALLGVLGVGAVAGVALTPALRARWSANTLLVVSALAYGAGTAALVWLPMWVVIPGLVLAGIAWITTLTALNAAIQLSVAHWVRARAMSVYLLVFMGSQAAGSLVWGWVASTIGLVDAALVATALLVIVAASVALLPLLPDTGTLDRTVSSAWPTPTVVFEPEPDDGPVQITVSYTVEDSERDAFTAAMAGVGRSRRRTGAFSWRLYRSLDNPELILEQFRVPSWSQYRRQRDERWTGSDHEVIAAALTHVLGGAPAGETHAVCLSPRHQPAVSTAAQ